MTSYPVNLELTDRQVLVVGGGRVARRKVERLLAAGAEVQVISPELIEPLAELAANGAIDYSRREFKAEDLAKQLLVIAATDQPEVNQRVGKLARANEQLVNVVDDKQLSNFTLPAVVKQGDLLLTAATGGNLPALAKLIRQRLEQEFGSEFKYFLKLMNQLRPIIKEKIDDEQQRRQVFRRLADWNLIKLWGTDRKAGIDKAANILAEAGLKVEIENIMKEMTQKDKT